MKDMDEYEVICGKHVVRDGSVQSRRVLLVHVGVLSGFFTEAKNVHTGLVVAPPPPHYFLDMVNIYAL